MAQLRRRKTDIEAAGGAVILVGMGKPAEAETFRERFEVPFPLVCDPDRGLYAAFGLGRMGWLGLLSPSLALQGLAAAAGEGHLMGLPAGDVRQLAGGFVVDTEGRVRYAHRDADPADLVPLDEVVDALRAIAGP